MKLKIIAIVVCISLLLSVPVFAAVMGEPVDGSSAVLAEGLVLTETSYWTGSDYRREHYLTLAPGGVAVPVAVSGDPLWSMRSLSAAAAGLEERGLRAAAGSNGGYYTIATGEPVGLVASGGVLRTDDEGLQAVGFCTDGSVVFGKPEIQLSLQAGEQTIPVAALNRASGNGLKICTSDCANTIKPNAESWCALCVVDGELGFSDSVKLTVEKLWETDASVSVPEGYMLLLQEKTGESTEQGLPEAVAVGAALTLYSSCAPDWEDVDSGIGILYPLLENGELVSGLEPYAAPRTAIGVKADGSIVIYTVDGRQSGHSVGAGLSGVAKRMQELGCVTAGALDGGGSTQLAAVMPGEDTLSVINRPSDGSARRVVNYILAAVPDEAPGDAAYLALFPLHINAVSGAEIPLEVKAIDRNGRAVAVPGQLSFSISEGIGQLRDGVFYAEGTGSGTITVSAPGIESAEIPVRVTASPEKLALYGEVYGKHTTALTLEPGQEVDLTVRATDRHVQLSGDDSCYVWVLEPEAGTVDVTGHVIPADVSGSGMLSVSAGESCIAIPINIWTGVPFRDVAKNDSHFAAVKYVYDNQIFEGTSTTSFEPDTVMNRAMLVTVLWRMCGKPEAAVEAAFADVPQDCWYDAAVDWAAERGLVNGYSETEFGPMDDLTQEQILTILYRWAGQPEPEAEQTAPEGTSDYGVPALCWAREKGLIGLPTDGELQPQSPMTRADVAEVLMRWAQLSNK